MSSPLDAVLQLEVPIIVRLGRRDLPVDEALRLVPGAIIELPKPAEEDLDLLVNNRLIGRGSPVKIGENFGIQINRLGSGLDDQTQSGAATDAPAPAKADPSLDELAEQLMAGQ